MVERMVVEPAVKMVAVDEGTIEKEKGERERQQKKKKNRGGGWFFSEFGPNFAPLSSHQRRVYL